MAKRPIDSDLGLALTFDDVLLVPAASEVMPSQVTVASRVTRSISLNIPILSSAMDTVTEGRLAIAVAQEGGIGVLHRNLVPEEQARHAAMVKKYESGIVLNPVTIHPTATLDEALKLMAQHSISGIPVVETPKKGESKVVPQCTYPLTGLRCVSRIYTDLAVIDITPKGLVALEWVDGLSFDELCRLTGAPLARAQ